MASTRVVVSLALFLVVVTSLPAQTNAAPASQADALGHPDSKKLTVTRMVRPVYPDDAVRDALQGQVIVDTTISEAGDVESAKAMSGHAELYAAAEAAVRQWKFEPFYRNGKPVKVSSKIPVNFAFTENVQQNVRLGPSRKRALLLPEGVVQGLLLTRVTPTYPPEAKRRGIAGTVVFQATIGEDGSVRELQVVSGPAVLVRSAQDAVQLWRYRPYMQDGKPVPVDTTITVNYRLAASPW